MSALRSAMTARSVVTFALPVLAASSLAHPALSQVVDGARSRTEVTWAMSVTNKGISGIPAFTLGKPAASLDASIHRGGFSVNPQFRVGLDGTPWSFLVWGRYRLLDRDRLRVSVGAYPALAFRTATVSVNGVAREVVVARHFAAGELSPRYALSRNVTVGTYYLYSHGLDADVTRHTHFVAARAGLANLRLPAVRRATRSPGVLPEIGRPGRDLPQLARDRGDAGSAGLDLRDRQPPHSHRRPARWSLPVEREPELRP